jgi:hypothetical protein
MLGADKYPCGFVTILNYVISFNFLITTQESVRLSNDGIKISLKKIYAKQDTILNTETRLRITGVN